MHDLAIIGAGPAGSTLALVCAANGLDTVLVDARPTDLPARADTRNYAVVRGSWHLLESAVVTARIDRADIQPLNGLEATDGSHGFGAPSVLFSAADIPPGGGDGNTLGWMIEAETLQTALDAAVAEETRLKRLRPALFENYEPVEGGVSIALQNGRVIEARLLAGCDGVNSPVRTAAGIGVEGREYGKSVFAANVALDRPHDGIARQLFTPEGPFATLPLTGDRANLAWYMKSGAAEALARRTAEEIEAELNHRFADFAGRMRLDGPVSAYPLRLQIARDMIAGRVALVGDAAHRINPLAGQGLNLGFKDVAVLAELASQAVRCGLDPGAANQLEDYRRKRRFDDTLTALGMDAIDRLYSNENPVLKPLRGLALGAADRLPWLRGALASQASATRSGLPGLMKPGDRAGN
ncbi:MAG: 2-octaprenyl-3-methyl-6-methoxy-1,4-benzoquinol hydroxylase [Alphaproteobacteria bacterium]|jgi:2-octaprenyl-6-methoxyphenol hydroxylase|nr:2-octaprenyl-3-methyl-6-methoxy-1,4-benzoquinol hydroxylase [Alphaproteobacteria bacterium]